MIVILWSFRRRLLITIVTFYKDCLKVDQSVNNRTIAGTESQWRNESVDGAETT